MARWEQVMLGLGFLAVAVLLPLTAWEAWKYSQRQTRATAPVVAATTFERAPATTETEAEPVAAPTVAAPRPKPTRKAPARAVTDLRLSAARGDAWVEARAGSSTGKTLFLGTLAQGKGLHLRSKAVWLRLGAPAALNATLNGKRLELPDGTADVLVTSKGLRVVAVG